MATPTLDRRKTLGAYYTPPAIAAKLVEWSVRSADDSVIDPSFGGSVFLEQARDRLRSLGMPPERAAAQIYGVDVDEAAVRTARRREATRGTHLVLEDFFALRPGDLPSFSANVGNPPYVRYQTWNGGASTAHEAAREAGVGLSRLSSFWAPFIVHGTRFLQPGGRLGQVLPAELLHAQYARPVTEFLRRSFRSLTIVVFEERVFPGALEEVVLLFGEGYGEGPAPGIGILERDNVSALELSAIDGHGQGYLVPELPLLRLLPPKAQLLYERLAATDGVKPLSEIAEVDIGAVTGANDFFLRTRREIVDRGFESGLFQTAVARATDLAGARLSTADIETLAAEGRKTELLVAQSNGHGDLPAAVAELVKEGEAIGVASRYKCRIRSPWWSVPLPRKGVPHALLTYMSNAYPRLVHNEAGALSTNTLHNVRLKTPASARALAVGFYNSLTLLSAELVGRSYGGGILKLEPTDAERLLVPPLPPRLGGRMSAVDKRLRAGDLDSALDEVDRLVLEPLRIDPDDVAILRAARQQLQARRMHRGRRGVA